jgi:predicted molibdopterin-dependent oxidoreductase YjgC
MFARLPEAPAAPVAVTIDGAPFEAREGDSVAAALLCAGHPASRTTAVSGAARGPFCMTGVCFDCLVEIDAVPNQQACMVSVAPGMRIVTQRGAPAIGASGTGQ